eukprot:GHVL01024429.1.p2 GENE.GHVL01024429.1~~GHVL01024429.1.p2  ORF type:complete len:220 (-),score=49.82 GHVL01024429.1:1199-1858(-)
MKVSGRGETTTREPTKPIVPDGEMQSEDSEFEDIIDKEEFDEDLMGSELDRDEPLEITNCADSAEDCLFDSTVGALQQIVMDEEFNKLQECFFKENCVHFEDIEENKLIYTSIFNEYSKSIEDHLTKRLQEALGTFEMTKFTTQMCQRPEELDGELFDLLTSIADFATFKELMISYKQKLKDNDKEGLICIDGIASAIHADEVEEGEARPDIFVQSTKA